MATRMDFDSPEEVAAKMSPVIDKAITAAAITIADRAVRNIKSRPAAPGEKIGRGGGRVSRPGETPTTQLGQLRNRIFYTQPFEGSAFVGTDVAYGRHLEFGTSRGMAPRPWLRRSLAESRLTAITNALRAARKELAKLQ